MNTIVDFSLAGGVAKILPIKIDGITAGRNSMVKTTIGYNDPSSTTATGQVKTWKSGATTYTYAYDARGNITSVSDGQSTTTYAYDSFDQLVRENNQAAGKTWTYAYDDGGNILSKTEYAYTTGSLGAAVRTIAYGYGDASWSDLLTSIGGQSLTADEIGNLLSDGTWTYTWQHGRQLAGMSKAGTNITYGYDSDGRRITKNVNGTTYNYHYLGDQLVELTWGGNKLHFTYDSTGPLSVNCNGTEYFYVKNAQGDVTGLVSASGTRVVTYTYDAWGNPLSTTGSLATTLGEQNPLRYRGYVYDTETGFYYISSRYYDPEIGRFLNADDPEIIDGGNDHILENNLCAYCFNNPVNMTDDTGYWPKWATNLVKIGIGALAIGVGIAATVATGGMLAPVLVASLKIAVTSAAIGAAVGAGTSAVNHRVSTGSWSGAGKAALSGAVDGAADGFMWGGISAGATFTAVAAKGVKIQQIGKLTPTNKLGKGYQGVQYKNQRGSLKSFELHSPHKSGPHQRWHWQQNTWNPKTGGITGRSIHWTLFGRRF